MGRKQSKMGTAILLGAVWTSASACDENTAPAVDAGCGRGSCTELPTPAVDAAPPPSRPVDSDAGDIEPTSANALPCDVAAVLESRCSACHAAGGVAPTSFLSATDFQGASKKTAGKTVAQTARTRIASTSNGEMMPPAGSPKLSDSERATLDAWLAAGAPGQRGATCAGSGTADAGADAAAADPTETCYRITAHDAIDRKAKYKVGLAADAYINFAFASPWGPSTRYAVTLKPIIDNAKVLHHWLLFQEGGVDGSVLPGSGAHPGGQLLTGWAPGGDGIDLHGNPDDVGYEMPGGGYVMEFHYNSSDLDAQDASGVEICLMDRKPKNVAAVSWVGSDNLTVPSNHWTGECHPASLSPIHIIAVSPHMHKTGTRMRAVINRNGGASEVLHDEPFDFNYQRGYVKDVVLNPGDWIRTDCYYSGLALFGESTGSEMCYLFTVAYPKGALADLGVWGAVAHGGSSCVQ